MCSCPQTLSRLLPCYCSPECWRANTHVIIYLVLTRLLEQFSAPVTDKLASLCDGTPKGEVDGPMQSTFLIVEEQSVASGQYVGLCLLPSGHQAPQPVSWYMFFLRLFPPFCVNCQSEDQIRSSPSLAPPMAGSHMVVCTPSFVCLTICHCFLTCLSDTVTPSV